MFKFIAGLAVGLMALLLAVTCSQTAAQTPAAPAPARAPEKKPVSARAAIDLGLNYLRSTQEADGSYQRDIGITGLVIKAMADSPRKYREADGPFVSKAVEYLLANQKEDGGIRGEQLGSYTTAIAVMALESLENPKYKDPIDRAVKYLKAQQLNVANGYDPTKHYGFGGFGYGSSMRPDMSNTQMVMDAFQAAGLAKDDPAYKDVVVFLSRCQNNSETNDQAFAGTDGGSVYSPVESKAGEYAKADGGKGLRSYGSMTYALLKTFIYANLSKEDPRVQAALGWIRKHYTVDENPELGDAGLYYYYMTFAKTLSAYGEDTLVDDAGKTHNWRKDLTEKLVSLQRPDGSWVNKNAEWWENMPVLVTSYAVLALEDAQKK